MKTVFFGNNRVGLETLKWLMDQPGEVVGLVVHPDETARFRDEIVQAAGLPDERVLVADALRSASGVERLAGLGGEIGFSAFFAYILKPEVLNLFPRGVVNLHPGYLPYNRGRHTNIWGIVDRTPAGATIHYVDEGIDTGDIIQQVRVDATAYDTGESLYRRLEDACIRLAAEAWPKVVSGTAPRIRQSGERTTYHRGSDIEALDQIELDRVYSARYLIDVMRARTFPPYPGAYFIESGEKVYLRLQLIRESELDDQKEQLSKDE